MHYIRIINNGTAITTGVEEHISIGANETAYIPMPEECIFERDDEGLQRIVIIHGLDDSNALVTSTLYRAGSPDAIPSQSVISLTVGEICDGGLFRKIW